MIVFETCEKMSAWSRERHEGGETIAFVPTMGFLHEGHLSLLRKGKELGARLVLSLFVNPTQFGPGEDFDRYPRDIQGDLEKAEKCGVDAVFIPTVETMYPEGFQTICVVGEISKPLCGKIRPVHFQGVTTVVLKLFHIVSPEFALFGQKDFQQLKVIERMVKDLNLPVEIVPMPIVREGDGLAMSSRNKYLSSNEREAARVIFSSLQNAKRLVDQGNRDSQRILNGVSAALEETQKIKIDYLHLCDPDTLEEMTVLKPPALLAVACFVGKTRLIDNILIV